MYIYAAQELWIKFSAKNCAAQYKHTEWLMLVKFWNANNDSPYLAYATEQSGIRSVQYQRSFGCKDWFCSKFTSSKEMQIPNEATNSIKMKVYPFENGQNETLPHWALASLQAQEQLHILSACTSSYSLWQHDKKVKMWSLSKNIMPDVSHYTRYGYINHFFNFLAFMYTIFFALAIIIDMLLRQKLIEVMAKIK